MRTANTKTSHKDVAQRRHASPVITVARDASVLRFGLTPLTRRRSACEKLAAAYSPTTSQSQYHRR